MKKLNPYNLDPLDLDLWVNIIWIQTPQNCYQSENPRFPAFILKNVMEMSMQFNCYQGETPRFLTFILKNAMEVSRSTSTKVNTPGF